MRLQSKLILAAFAAAALLGTAASGADARNLSVNERNFELIWNEALGSPKTGLEVKLPSLIDMRCKITLLGRYNASTIAKNTSTNQGTINHEESVCEGTGLVIQTETMPWNLRYRSFTGTLPRIRSIDISLIGVAFRVREPNGFTCEWRSEVNHPAVFIMGNSAEAAERELETTGEAENITAERGNRIPQSEESLCGLPGELELSGIGLMRNLPRTAKVRVTLI